MAPRTTDASPRARGGGLHAEGSVEGLLREILAGQAGFDARLEDLSGRLGETAADARQARDLGNRISTILEEQNIIARFDSHKTDIRQAMAEMRQDFVAAYTNLRKDLESAVATAAAERAKLDGRIKQLETDRERREGARSLAGWLVKNAPWLVTLLAGFGAGVGLKDKIP